MIPAMLNDIPNPPSAQRSPSRRSSPSLMGWTMEREVEGEHRPQRPQRAELPAVEEAEAERDAHADEQARDPEAGEQRAALAEAEEGRHPAEEQQGRAGEDAEAARGRPGRGALRTVEHRGILAEPPGGGKPGGPRAPATG
jgi:hypothetical protein